MNDNQDTPIPTLPHLPDAQTILAELAKAKSIDDLKYKMKFSDARWNDIKTEMRQIMIEVAKSRQVITYAELCATLKTAYLHYHSPLLTRLLIEIGGEEFEAGRPILPAVVVSKQSGIPGAGYFKVERDELEISDPRAYWEADLQRLFDYWSAHD
jgi:hypothetical protein